MSITTYATLPEIAVQEPHGLGPIARLAWYMQQARGWAALAAQDAASPIMGGSLTAAARAGAWLVKAERVAESIMAAIARRHGAAKAALDAARSAKRSGQAARIAAMTATRDGAIVAGMVDAIRLALQQVDALLSAGRGWGQEATAKRLADACERMARQGRPWLA